MGSTSWRDDILQALLIGLVVQIVVSVLWVFWAFLRAAWEERLAVPTTGESVAESDVEMGMANVGEGATTADNPPLGLAANSGVGDDGNLEDTMNTTDTRASTPEIPTIHGSSTQAKAQCKKFTEDVKREESLCLFWCMFHTLTKSARCWWERKPNLQIPVATPALFSECSTLL